MQSRLNRVNGKSQAAQHLRQPLSVAGVQGQAGEHGADRAIHTLAGGSIVRVNPFSRLKVGLFHYKMTTGSQEGFEMRQDLNGIAVMYQDISSMNQVDCTHAPH